MARHSTIQTSVMTLFAIVLASPIVCFPVFAENPLDINIIEVVDDGNGGYKPWEDITGAMPGMAYSAIPRIANNGTVPAEVEMCLLESAVSSAGETVALSTTVFEFNIGENWTLSGKTGAHERCYNYNSTVKPGDITEPLFTTVTISRALGSQYENHTFTLHLNAFARNTQIPTPGTGDPNAPNTGTTTEPKPLSTAGYFFLSFGIIALIVMAAILFASRRHHQ